MVKPFEGLGHREDRTPFFAQIEKSLVKQRAFHVKAWVPEMLVNQRCSVITEDDQALLSPVAVQTELEDSGALRNRKQDELGLLKHSRLSQPHKGSNQRSFLSFLSTSS